MSGLIERYAAGLTAGTDPRSPDRWPPITDRSQPMVEAASLAIALHETRPWIWDRLDDRVRQRVADWLGGFVGAVVNDSNWRLFQVITEEFLASVGAPHSRSEIDAGLARLEDWYRATAGTPTATAASSTTTTPRNPAVLGPGLPLLGEQGLPRPAPARRPSRVDGARGTRPGGDGRRVPRLTGAGLAAALHRRRRDRPARQPRQQATRNGRGQPALRPVRLLQCDGARDTGQPSSDNHIALLAPDGTPTPRGRIHPLGVRGHAGQLLAAQGGAPRAATKDTASRRSAWCTAPGRSACTAIDAPPGTPVREGGWAVADDSAPPAARTGPGWALARRADGLTSTVVGLHG
ncbi:hypothetical protein SVIOM74S_00811 [Streptomyces violarus]